MNTIECINSRSSCKNYDPNKKVSKQDLQKIAEAGSKAATGMNKQAPIILVIDNKEIRDKLAKLNREVLGVDSDTFYGAPQMLCVLAKSDVRTHVYDGSIVMANMMLAAEELGLGSCWIHRAREVFTPELLSELGIEGEYEGIGNLAVGYPAGERRQSPPRKEDWIRWYE